MAIQNIIMAAAAASSGSNHRYWRIFITSGMNSNQVGLSEVELHAVIGGSDLTTPGGPAAASSVLSGGDEATSAIDDNPATAWFSAPLGFPAWWSYDFVSQPQVIIEVSIHMDSALSSYGPIAFSLQRSDDNATFLTTKSWTAGSWSGGGTLVFN